VGEGAGEARGFKKTKTKVFTASASFSYFLLLTKGYFP